MHFFFILNLQQIRFKSGTLDALFLRFNRVQFQEEEEEDAAAH